MQLLAKHRDRMVLPVPDDVSAIDGGEPASRGDDGNDDEQRGADERLSWQVRQHDKSAKRPVKDGNQRQSVDRWTDPRLRGLVLLSALRQCLQQTAFAQQAHQVRVRRRTAVRVSHLPQEVEA